MTRPGANPTQAVLDSLQEAGLGGQIRIGVSSPALPPREPGEEVGLPRTEEEGFPPDHLLRPLERPDQGRLIELAGERSSGRTALAYRLAAGATQRGGLVGWVDLPDALDPRFLRRSGVDLQGLLWTRPPHARAALRAAELLVKTGFALVVLDLDGASPRELQGLGSATWTRLLRALRGARATVVVLGCERVSGSFSTLGLSTDRRRSIFDRGLFEGLEASVSVVRNRTGPTDVSCSFRVRHRPVPAGQPSAQG